MKTRFHPIALAALAISGGAFALAAPMAQAALDKYPEEKGVKGGSLFVVDPTQPITVTLGIDDDLFHPIHEFLWRDGVDGEWQLLYDDIGFQSAKNKNITFTLQPTSSEVFFAVSYTYGVAYSADKEYLFSTGDGSLNWYSDNVKPSASQAEKLGQPHATVIYDTGLDGQVGAQPGTVWVGFEDTRYFFLADWDDFQFQATNLASTAPEPEAYAMLLAGLGIVGFAAKRRRRTM